MRMQNEKVSEICEKTEKVKRKEGEETKTEGS